MMNHSSKRIGILLFTGIIITIISTAAWAFDEYRGLGSPSENESKRAADSARGLKWEDFQFVGELYLGYGISENLGASRPPESFYFALRGVGGLSAQVRIRTYYRRVGLSVFADGHKNPIGLFVDNSGIAHEATSVSVQLLGSIHTEPFNHRLRLEPLLGLGRLSDRATSTREGKRIYREEYDEIGPVFGMEQIVRLGKGFQVRGIYTYGAYEFYDQRLKLELQFSTDALFNLEYTKEDRDKGALSFTLGYHGSWKGDGRIERIFYLGAGLRLRGVDDESPGGN